MEGKMRFVRIFSLFLLGIVAVPVLFGRSAEMQVLVNGIPLANHYHRGTKYLEATKGEKYAIRITNPLGVRVAVALSVDGLNTIDARHTDARSARKWVLGPYESMVISGWQMNSRQARRFFFTTEDRSYAAGLGQVKNLGIISAAFFRERTQWVHNPKHTKRANQRWTEGNSQAESKERPEAEHANSSNPRLRQSDSQTKATSPAEEYAATGIGEHVSHKVRLVHMNLEPKPFTVVNLRYEFRPALVKLGVIPPSPALDTLTRRERAEGFHGVVYCPKP